MAGVDLGPPSDPPDVDGLSEAEAIQAMAAWFLENFEDPANETPYESAEGGYQYVWGGPHGAGQEMFDAFGHAVPLAWIEKAAEQVQDIEGVYDWAPSSNRFYEEPDEDGTDAEPLEFEKLQARLNDVEALLEKLAPEFPRIGHNRPPSPIDEVALTESDANELRAAIVVLREQEQFPDEIPPKTLAAAEKVKGFWSKAGAYLLKLGDTAATSAASELGKKSVQVMSFLMFYNLLEKLFAALGEAIKAFETWLKIATLF